MYLLENGIDISLWENIKEMIEIVGIWDWIIMFFVGVLVIIFVVIVVKKCKK